MTVHDDQVLSVAFSEDGKYLASGSTDETAAVWDATTGELIRRFVEPHTWVYAVAFSPDGSVLACAYDSVHTFRDPGVVTWDTKTGDPVQTLKGHHDRVISLAFSQDGNAIVTGSGDCTVRVWNTKTGDELLCLEGHDGPVTAVCFSPDGKYVVSAGQSYHPIRSAFNENLPKGSAFRVWCLEKVFVKDPPQDRDWHLVRVWDAVSGKHLFSLEGHRHEVADVKCSFDGRYIACASDCLRIYSSHSGLETKCLKGPHGSPTCLAFSRDSRYIVTEPDDISRI